MADILKISTPLIDNSKTTVQPGKQVDPTQQFNLSEIDRVVQTNQQSEILKQHTGLLEQESPAILMNMLKDPSVTVSFLLIIYMLQEIIQKNPEEKVTYVLVGENGPDHDKHFAVEVRLNSNVIGRGESRSKKGAEQRAAKEALELMGE